MTLPPIAIHFVDAINWPSVQKHGLRSAALLMQIANVDAEAVRTFRPACETLPDGVFVRDQRPMPPAALERCLDPGLTPADWYALVNQGVYFWLDADRAERHQRALRTRPQVRLEFSVADLVAAYGPSAFVTPFNIGSALRRPARRGLRTLVPIDRWVAAGWEDEAFTVGKTRSRSQKPAELIIQSNIPDALCFVKAISFIPAVNTL